MPVPEIGNDFFFIIFKMFHSFNQPVIVTKLRFMLFTSIVHECDVQKNLINDTCKSLNSMQKLTRPNDFGSMTARKCDILRCTTIYCDIQRYTAIYCKILQYTAIYCNILQYTAICCDILQYTAIVAKHCHTRP